jgi:predicted transcriptional regulator
MRNGEDTDSIAYRLNYLMHEKRLTAKEFSSLCHIPMSSLFGYTSGKTEPKASTIMRIAEALRVDPRWFSGRNFAGIIGKPVAGTVRQHQWNGNC